MLAIALLAVPVLAPQDPARDAPALLSGSKLRYVESSDGLQTPTLDGGDTEIEFGDVDGDGHVDIVSVGDHGSPFINTPQHGVMVWFGDGTGTWNVFQFGNFGYGGVALGDANGDGLMDVGYGVHHDYSSTDLGDQLLEVALGDGTGQSWTAWDDGLATNGETWGMNGTDFADVDNDGDLDVGANSFGCCAGVHVYLNHEDGTWSQSFGFTGSNANSQFFLFDDIDNDGNADIAVGHQLGFIYLGDGAGDFVRADTGISIPIGGKSGFDLGDVDGDGDLEIALPTGGGVELWRYVGGGAWERFPTVGLPSIGPLQLLQLADMNGDGLMDVVGYGRRIGVVLQGDGQGAFTLAARFETPGVGNGTCLRAGRDADHNGLPDIAVIDDEGAGFNMRHKLHFFKEASVPTALRARVVAPGANRVLRAGSVRNIDWLSAVPPGQTSTVTLELSTSGAGGPWTAIAAGVPDNGRYQWTVPAEPSNDCRIRVTVTSGSGVVRAVGGRLTIL